MSVGIDRARRRALALLACVLLAPSAALAQDPRGALGQRTVATTTFAYSVPGLPEGGSYALVTFHSAFANDRNGVEEVTLEVGPDYAWRVIGYVIQ